MLIFICLFLPLSAYLATKFLLPPALLHKLVFPICASVILFSTVTVLYQILTAVEWSDNTQIAWTSIETQENSLMVGGAPESSIVGWPNDNDTPQIKFSNAGAKRVTLEIAQSTALIVDEEQKTFLNGKTLAPEQAVNFAQNNITLHRGWFGYSNYLIVSNSQNEEVIRFSPPAAQKTSRVYSLELMINNHAGELRKDAAAFLALGDWAANLRVAVLSTGELRIISKDEQPPPADCTAPCSLNIIWSNNRLPFKVRTDNQRMSLVFAAPWRASSRLPPEGQNAVVVTKEPQPGDYAFVLPFGEAVKMTGQPLALTPDSSRNLISAPNSNAGVSIDNASIKSTAVVKIDKNYYGFATVQSLPHRLIITGLISLSVLIALIGLLLVAQSLTINYGSARWVFGGLFAVFWMLLLLRFALAIRYLLDPAYLDADTIKGFVSALIALAVCPAALAFLTKLYFDWQSRRSGTVAPAKYAFLKIATKSGVFTAGFYWARPRKSIGALVLGRSPGRFYRRFRRPDLGVFDPRLWFFRTADNFESS